MRKRLFVSTVVALFFCQGILAQPDELKFHLLDDLNGQPVRKITSITQDSYGAMWFAGEGAKCLLKYDGSRLTSYKHNENDPHSLAMTTPFMVAADSNGVVWVSGGEGLDKFDPLTGHFIHYRNDPNDPTRLSKGAGELLVDSKGRLWIGSEGLYLMNKKTGEFKGFKSEPGNAKSLSDNVVISLYEDHQGTIWVGTGSPWFNAEPGKGGLNRMEPDGTFTQFLSDPKNPGTLISNKVNSIYEDSRNTFWVGTMDGGLHIMDRSLGTFQRYLYDPRNPLKLSRPPHQPMNDALRFIIEDADGQIWISGMSGGINRYNPKTDRITNYNKSNGFPDQSGWNAFISADQSLWITTEESHLYHTTPYRLEMKGIINEKNLFESDKRFSGIRRFIEDKSGTIWVGTSNGLWEYDKELRFIKRHRKADNDSTHFDGNVTGFYQDQPDSLWIGWGQGVVILNLKTREFSKIKLPEAFKCPAFSFRRDKSGKMWIGTLNGMAGYDMKTGHVDAYQPDQNDSTSIGIRGVMSIVEDKKGILWATTWGGGINRLDRSTGKFKHYLPQSIAYCMYEDSEEILWVGTSHGLFRYERDKDIFTRFFNSQSGLEFRQVATLVEDDRQNLWVAMAPGLMKIDKARTETTVYWQSYGDVPISSEQAAIYHTRDDRILLGNDQDFSVFHPDDLNPPYRFKIILSNLLVNNLAVTSAEAGILSGPLEAADEITLRYNENSFDFSVGCDDYRLPATIRYFAKLDGYGEWRDLSASRNSGYDNVPPGSYTLKIRAYNLEGTLAERSIVVLISPPWWKTWWAYSFYGIALIGLGLGGFRVQRERIIAHERQKTQATELAQAKEIEKAYHQLRATQAQLIQSEKMASLGELTAGIAHEIQNPLNFVNNFSELNGELADELTAAADNGNIDEVKAVARGIKENAEKITHHGKRADAIVKGMLQHSRTSTGTKEPTDINALCDEYLRLSYHGLRAKDKSFNATLNTDFDQGLGFVKIIPQDIGRVILNLLTNAFYAAFEKKKVAGPDFEPTISVSTRKVANMIEIRVKDNGNGIPKQAADKIFQPFFTTKPSGQGTGLGLSLSYDIVKAHGGEIKVNSKEGEGTEFIVSIPI